MAALLLAPPAAHAAQQRRITVALLDSPHQRPTGINVRRTIRMALAPMQVHFRSLPFKRALRDLRLGRVDAFGCTFNSPGRGIYPEHPVFCVSMVGLCRTETVPAHDLQTDSPLRLLWRRGYSLQYHLPQGTWSFDEVDSLKSGLEMVLNDRADCLVDVRRLLLEHWPMQGHFGSLSMSVPLISRPVYLRFRDELDSLPVMRTFDAGMQRILQSGEYAAMWGPEMARCLSAAASHRAPEPPAQ